MSCLIEKNNSRSAVEQEKARCRELEAQLEGERTMVQRLKDVLNMERENSRSIVKQHSDHIEVK